MLFIYDLWFTWFRVKSHSTITDSLLYYLKREAIPIETRYFKILLCLLYVPEETFMLI